MQGGEGGTGGHRPGVRVGWGVGGHRSGCVSDVLGVGANSPRVPPTPHHPPHLLQALGHLSLVADGAGATVQAVIVTGQAARCYLPVRAAVGHRGSAPRAPMGALCHPWVLCATLQPLC